MLTIQSVPFGRPVREFGLGILTLTLLVPASLAQDSEAGFVNAARSEIELGRLDDALSTARSGLARYPRSAALEQLSGICLFKKGANEQARQAFRRAISLDPAVPQNYYDLALVDLSENRYAEAAPRLRAYLEREPRNAEAHLLLGRALHNLNMTMPAIVEFKAALALDPKLPLAHYHLGYAYQSQGNVKAALAEFEEEIRLDPHFPDSYWLAANIELGEGNLVAAESLYRRALKIRPANYPALYGLGRVLLARGQAAAALTELEQASQLAPGDVRVHYALAEAYRRLGRAADADREFQTCARLNAESQSAKSGIAGNSGP